MNNWVFIWVLAGLLICAPAAYAGNKLSKSTVLLEIIDGDTAFVVDMNSNEAWWLVGQCKRALPMGSSYKTQKNTMNAMTSEIILERVRIGNRQVNLKQQFRFTRASHAGPYSVEVFNSLRRGWSPVPVELKANCALDAPCRRRMEAPQC